MRRLALALVLPLLAAAPAAAQESCAAAVDRLAERFGIPSELPTAQGPELEGTEGAGRQDGAATGEGSGGSATMSDKLAQSGGVISPPETAGRTPTFEPAMPSDGMQTMPRIEPQTGSGQASPPQAAEATERAQAGALLTAARAAAERGDEGECRRNLTRAMGMLGG